MCISKLKLVVWEKTWLMISSCGWRIFSFVVLIFARILASCHVNSKTNPCAILKNTNCSIAKTVASNSSLVPVSSTKCWHSAMSKKHCSMLSARVSHSAQNLGSIWQTIQRMDNCMLYNFPFNIIQLINLGWEKHFCDYKNGILIKMPFL